MQLAILFACLPGALALRTLADWQHADDVLAKASTAQPWHDADFWQEGPDFPETSLAEAGKKPKYETDFRKEPRSRVLVLPEKKLAFCYIEKNGCKQFNRLFNSLNRRWGGLWYLSTMMNFNLDWHDVSRAKGWKWAVFLRDPLPRYLSAWGSKCVLKEEDANCVGFAAPNGTVADFEANVRASNEGAREANPHWARQQDFCGGLKDAADYDFVGLLRGDVHGQVKAMLGMVNASLYEVGRYFPEKGVAGHHSSLLPSSYYRNEAVQRQVMEMYAEDFRLPGLEPHFVA